MGCRGRAPWALTGKVLWGDPQEGVGEPPAQTQGPQGSCARHLPQHGVCVCSGASLLLWDPIPCPLGRRRIGGDLGWGGGVEE